jgi:hypothetical protein
MTLYMSHDRIEYRLFELQSIDDLLIEARANEVYVNTGLPLLPYPVNAVFELRTCVERPGILPEYHGGTMVLRFVPPDEGVPIPSRYGLNAYDAALWLVVERIPIHGYFGVCHIPPYEGGVISRECCKQDFPGISVDIRDNHFTGDFVINEVPDFGDAGITRWAN